MPNLIIIGLGGFLGAIARHGLSGLAHRISGLALPVGTLIVNGLGCLAIGITMSIVDHRGFFSPTTNYFLMIGFVGSFTTFSALGYETFQMIRAGNFHLALGNIGINVIVGIGAVVLGWFAVQPFK